MASLTGKLVSQTEVKSNLDVLFDIYAHKLYLLVNGAPDVFKSLDLLDGFWGLLGCIISGTFVYEGKTKIVKMTLAAIDEAEKSVTYLIIGGDILSLYSTFSATLQLGTTEDGRNVATWTMEYLKLLPLTSDPTWLMDLAVAALQEIDAQNLQPTATH